MNSNQERELVVIGNLETIFGKYIAGKYRCDKIKFLGFVSGIEKLNSLRYFSNLYFHGHSVGGTNPSLLEAMSSRALICASDNIFNKSILEENGYYFNSSCDISGFINLIRKDEKEEAKLKSNTNKIKTIYSWKKIVNDYHEFFNAISLLNWLFIIAWIRW